MKRFTSIQLGGSIIKYTSYLMLSLFLIPNLNFANTGSPAFCQIACNDNVQISLNKDCTGITPDMVIEGTLPAGSFTIKLPDGKSYFAVGGQDPFTDAGAAIDWSDYVGPNVNYEIIANGCSGSCWGSMTLEANILPSISSPFETDYFCPTANPPTEMILESISGYISNNSEDDVLLDPAWYGVGEPSGWHADIVKFSISADHYDACPSSSIGLEITSSFKHGVKTYDDVVWNAIAPGAFIYLGSDGSPLNPQPLGALLPGDYSVLVWANNNDAIGPYTINVVQDKSSCVTVSPTPPSTTIYCDQQYPDGWIHYTGVGGALEMLGDVACGLKFEEVSVHEEVCGDICDVDGEVHIVTYFVQISLHGKTSLRQILRQGFVRKQQIPSVCDPAKEVYLTCGEETSPEHVFSSKFNHLLSEGYDSLSAKSKAYTFAYPHICDGPFIDYVAKVDTIGHEYNITGSETRTVWEDLDNDGVQDFNEWVEREFVIKEVVEKPGVKMVICKDIVDANDDGIDDNNPYCEAIHSIIPLSEKYCGYVAYADDFDVPECGGGKKVIRSWSLLNWCDATITRLASSDQTIYSKDTIPPIVVWKDSIIEANIDPWTCEISKLLPIPEATDNCSSPEELTVTYHSPIGTVNDGVFTAYVGEPGTTSVLKCTVSDACGNETSIDLVLKVVDNTPPVTVCKDNVTVSITPSAEGGIAKIFAKDFDAGSHEGGCGEIDKMKVIRVEDYVESIDHAFDHMSFAGLPNSCDPETKILSVIEKDKFGNEIDDTDPQELVIWSDFAKFCCEDVGKADLMVRLRVYDHSGNYNDCMVGVSVQDKFSIFNCPKDTVVNCFDYSNQLLYGEPTGQLICGDMEISYLDDESNLNSCGNGKIIRVWSGLEASGKRNVCTQIIQLDAESAFKPESIRWPIHYNGEYNVPGVALEPNDDGECVNVGQRLIGLGPILNCQDDIPVCEPEFIKNQSCGLVGISVKSDTILKADDSCMKIIRRWSVIDWCTWAPNSDPDNQTHAGDDENDTSADQFELVEDWCLTDGCIKEKEYSTYFRYKQTNSGPIVDQDGYYTFDQVLVFMDESLPEFMSMEIDTLQPATAGSCLGNIALINTARDEGVCGSEVLFWAVTLYDSTGTVVGPTQTGNGNAFGFTVTDIPLGKYTIDWRVKDGCGNEASQITNVELEDTSKPTPICIQNISTAVMNTSGEVEIWASDFDPDRKSTDPCGDELFYSFSKDSIVPNLTLTCAHVAVETQEMKVWVHDETGNATYCRVNIRVDANGVCDDFVLECDAEGGKFITEVTDLEEVTVCTVGSNTSFRAKVWENVGDPSWLTTDADGNIIDIPVGPSFDFAGQDPGVCYLWHLSSIGTITGKEIGKNAADIKGCYALSNPIIVTKVDSGDACEAVCDAEGGTFITDVTDLEETTVCTSGDNTGFRAKVWENVGEPCWLTTDADGNIIDLPVGPTFDFAGEDPGVCYLWHLSSIGPITGKEIGKNAADIKGCFALSNPIIVTKVDSGDACEVADGVALISGNVSTPFGEFVGNANVRLANADIAEYPVSQMTSGLSGNYAFSSNPMYSDYSVSVDKNDDHMNGVSTLDLVYMQHHILGLRPLDSPYKVIASDINNDQRITASDLVQLRKLILGIISELPQNDSWRFIDEEQTFANIHQPWPFVESLDLTDLSTNMSNQDFVGVKIGDVNGSAKPNSLIASEVRSNNSITLEIDDATYNMGDVVEMSVSSDEFSEVYGFQFTISHPGLELVGLQSDVLDINNNNIANHNTMSAVSWNTTHAVEAGEDLLTFVFIAKEDNIVLSETIEINDRISVAEIYTSTDYEINDINVSFESTIDVQIFELLQNEPNPFSDITEIGFKLPKSGNATLKLFDVTGRLIYDETGSFVKGLNKITISSDLIGSGGLIYYSLESGNYSATKKMILLK